MTVKERFAANLRYIMDTDGLSTYDLARYTASKEYSINEVLNDDRMPQYDFVELISSFAGVSVYSLFHCDLMKIQEPDA